MSSPPEEILEFNYRRIILYGMTSDSIVNVTEAQARLNKLIETDSFAISRHGKIMGIYLSRERIEALVESMELLASPGFMRSLTDYEAGRMKFNPVSKLDKKMSS